MLTLLNPPGVSPVGLDEVKKHLRLDHSFEDDYLEHLIKVGTLQVEKYLGRSLIKQTWQLVCHNHGGGRETNEIRLPNPPILDVVSIHALYPNEVKKPIKRYMVNSSLQVPVLTVGSSFDVIEVIYDTGYGAGADSVPYDLKQAILIAISELYEHRGNFVIDNHNTLQSILAPYRVYRLG